MGTTQVGLTDVRHGRPPSRSRLLAPLRYLQIRHPEKERYDFLIPVIATLAAWALYMVVTPRIALFGDAGLLKFTRDILIMGVPFMVGALASVAMGSPGNHMDRRPVGAELWLDGESLTLRQFVCYLLGYLSFVSIVVLAAAVGAELMKKAVFSWTAGYPVIRFYIMAAGSLLLCGMLSVLSVTVLWSLYFLTDIVNRKSS
ncbi:hypothetical protein [Chelatococcus reniformis]|uniref:Uncharacterized protein n=1 Tax=Chelatococcus reniformis TaxID=1494448 RepID=A0A916UVT1_9HYPH|nr:hypothetical protein [Chelatococcus reniformis]GGC90118.1 hypothetical protein GCM10010994_54940 [Chelatococcus reniformis]